MAQRMHRAPVSTVVTICRRGHLASIERIPGGYCTECGADTFSECPSCDELIAGLPIDSAHPWGELRDEDWERPSFCSKCGEAFPWADRQARIYELRNRLDREHLDEGTRLAVREQLEALADPDLSDEDATKRWKRVRELAPRLWGRSEGVITDLATAYVKRELGL